MPRAKLPCLLLVVGLLAACSSGDNDDPDAPPVIGPTPSPPARGTLLGAPQKLATYSATEIVALLATGEIDPVALSLALAPKCAIDVYQIRYASVGAKDEATESSGALMIPAGTDASCQGPRPILLYAHGTKADPAFNIAALTQSDNNEGVLIAAIFAGAGYIVVAPNYAGYDTSTLTYHPYLNADQQSKDMIDALAGARSGLPTATTSVTDNGKLFVTGYSQGGYVAMATQRAMQAAGTTVTASGPMSGPYTLSAFGDAIFQGQVNTQAVLNLDLIISSYQNAYGDIFVNPSEVFETPDATQIVFSSTPPAPEFASITPPTQPALFAPIFAAAFGTNNLIANSYRLGYLRDAQLAPDGGFPAVTDGLAPANPMQAFRRALKTNDLRTFVPTVPTLLCAGSSDPTVFFFNTDLMRGYWAATGPTAPVTILDVDSPIVSGDPYADLKADFANVKAVVRLTEGDDGLLDIYHAGLVPAFCLRAVREFFDVR